MLSTPMNEDRSCNVFFCGDSSRTALIWHSGKKATFQAKHVQSKYNQICIVKILILSG